MVACRIALASAVALTACGNFESPDIVLDLRILGVTTSPPEVVVDADDPDDIPIDDIPDVQVCALIADPAESRQLEYRMTACPPRGSRRCDSATAPRFEFGSGTAPDPEESDDPVSICGTLVAAGSLLAILRESVRADDLAGFGGVAVQIELEVAPVGAPEETQYASKKMRYSPRLPAERIANSNPFAERIMVAREANGERNRGFAAPLGRCGDVEPITALAGEKLTFVPFPGEGTREDYVVPTFDGGAREFTESLDYAWYATAGNWSSGTTGGPPDLSGNIDDGETSWTAPDDPEDVGDELDVRMWFVQRDERGGLAWYESCVRVIP